MTQETPKTCCERCLKSKGALSKAWQKKTGVCGTTCDCHWSEHLPKKDVTSTQNTPKTLRERELELVKGTMYAKDVDWEMSLENDSVKYLKSYQLHSKIRDLISLVREETLDEAVNSLPRAANGEHGYKQAALGVLKSLRTKKDI